MQTEKLSKDAMKLLRRCALGEHIEVTPDNLEAYRELARAGVMEPFSGFMRGPEAVFRFTQEGWDKRERFQPRRFTPSAMLRRIFRAFSPIGNLPTRVPPRLHATQDRLAGQSIPLRRATDRSSQSARLLAGTCRPAA
jgi:hypothetical protein